MNKSIRRIIFVILLLAAVFATACSDDRGTNKSSIDLDNLSMRIEPGVVNTTLGNIGELTPFKTRTEVDSFITAPISAVHDGKIYILRNFPAEFEQYDELYAYIDSGEYSKEIEVYDITDKITLCDTISLSGIGENRIIYDNMSFEVSDNTLYVTGRENIGGEFISYLYRFTLSGELISKKEVYIDTMSARHEICDGNIITLAASSSKNAVSTELIAVNADDGTRKTIAESVSQFFVADDSIYFIHNYYNDKYEIISELCAYRNESTETLFELSGWGEAVRDIEGSVGGIAFDAVNNILYYSHSGNIYAYYNGKYGTVITTLDAYADIIGLSGSSILVRVGYNQIAVYDIPANPTFVEDEQQVLKICCVHESEASYTSIYDSVLQFMNANGFSVKLEYTFITPSNEEYINTMAKKLLAGDSDFDIFVIDSALSSLFSEKYLLDLSQYRVLTPYYSSMLEGLADLCTVGKKTALVPTHLSTDVITAAGDCGSAELSLDGIFKTDTDSELLCGNKDSIALLMPWFNQLMSNYMANVISDSEAEEGLQSLYNYADKVMKSQNVYIGEAYPSKEYFMDFNMNIAGDIHDQARNKPYANALPKIADNYKNAVNCSFLAVNPKSDNIELAVAFLAYYMEASKLDMVHDQAYYYNGFTEAVNSGYDIFKEQIADSVREYSDPELYSYAVNQQALVEKAEIDINAAADNTLRYMKRLRDE